MNSKSQISGFSPVLLLATKERIEKEGKVKRREWETEKKPFSLYRSPLIFFVSISLGLYFSCSLYSSFFLLSLFPSSFLLLFSLSLFDIWAKSVWNLNFNYSERWEPDLTHELLFSSWFIITDERENGKRERERERNPFSPFVSLVFLSLSSHFLSHFL